MRWLIQYFAQCFCKHEFEFAEQEFKWKLGNWEKVGDRVSCTCKKCAYHKSYWKFN